MTVYQTMETTFDSNNNETIEKLKDSAGLTVSLVQYSYDSAGRLECTAVRMNTAAYGSLPSSACTLGTEGSYGPDRVAKRTYDEAGRVTRQQSGYGTSAVGDDGVLTYTANGKVATAKDGEANLTTYQYDGLDRLAKVFLPNTTKGVGASSSSDYEQYGYDANGSVTSRRTRTGESLTFAYDNLDRLTVKTVPERTGLSSTHTRDVYYGYDVLGRPSYVRFDSAAGADGLSFVFDALGRMTSTTQAMDGASRTLSYLYDATDRRTRVTWPDSGYVTYAYDTLNRPVTIADSASATLRSYNYGASGALSSDGAGGVTSSTYSVDSAGRLSSLARDLSGTSADDITTLSYNPAGQLAGETRSNTAYAWLGHTNKAEGYAIDGLNRYTSSGQGSTPYGTGYSYDANGNLTSDGSSTFTYDAENRLVSTTGTKSGSLRYDPLGRLYELTEGTTTTRLLYDGDALVGEYNTSGALLRRFAHGVDADLDNPIAWYEGDTLSANTRRFLHTDRTGSVVSVADNSGTSLAVNTYDEYGNSGSANLGRFQYTGQAWLVGLGLYYYKSRMYSPALGRFMQPDPIGYAQGLNWYDYVTGDPVNNVDPDGHMSCEINGTVYYPRAGMTSDDAKKACAKLGGDWADITVNGSSAMSFGQGLGGRGGSSNLGNHAPPSRDSGVAAAVKKVAQCAADHYGLGALGLGATAVGQPIKGTKPFVTAGSSRGTSLAGLGANKLLGKIQLPTRLPTIVGGLGTGTPLRVAYTKSAARFAARAVPILGEVLVAYDVISIVACSLNSGD